MDINKIHNQDCLEAMKLMKDNQFDLAIVDPPYGLNRFKAKDGGNSKKIKSFGDKNKNWNNIKPKKEYFTELFRISKNQIIWGANNFNLPTSEYFIIWQKGNALDFSFAMVEMAWTNIKKPAKLFKHLHVQNKDKRIHPTQKPVKLYEWLLMNYAKKGDKILDTHLGSGSIAIACHNLGYDLTGYELDKEYYDNAIKRIKNHQAQTRIF